MGSQGVRHDLATKTRRTTPLTGVEQFLKHYSALLGCGSPIHEMRMLKGSKFTLKSSITPTLLQDPPLSSHIPSNVAPQFPPNNPRILHFGSHPIFPLFWCCRISDPPGRRRKGSTWIVHFFKPQSELCLLSVGVRASTLFSPFIQQNGPADSLKEGLHDYLEGHPILLSSWTSGSRGSCWLTRCLLLLIWWPPQTFLCKFSVESGISLSHCAGWVCRDLPGGYHRNWARAVEKLNLGGWQRGWKGAGGYKDHLRERSTQLTD